MTDSQDIDDHGAFAGSLVLSWSGRHASFGLEAAAVERIVDEHEWGGSVLDMSSVLDLDSSLQPVRVLEIRAGLDRFGLRVFGMVMLRSVASSDLLELPSLLRVGPIGRLLRHLAVVDGAPALWVLDARALENHGRRLSSRRDVPCDAPNDPR